MGFLNDFIGPVLGGGLGFLVGGPAGAAIGAGIGAQISGAGQAAEAQQQAAQTQAQALTQAGQAQLQLGREQLEATDPLRQLALEQGQLFLGSQRELLPLLQQAINQPLDLGQGVSSIQSALAPFGLSDSSVSGRAVGQFAESARQNRLQNILAGLGFGQVNPALGTAGLGTAAALQQGGIQSQLGAGQSIAAGQLGAGQTQANLFSGLGGLAFQGGLSKLFGGTGTVVQPTTSATPRFGGGGQTLTGFQPQLGSLTGFVNTF